MWLDVSLKKEGTMIIIFLDCKIFGFWLPECYIIQRVMIQNSVSGSFFPPHIKNPIPGYVKLIVSVEKYCALLKWRGVYVIKYNICAVMNEWFMQINLSVILMDRLIGT